MAKRKANIRTVRKAKRAAQLSTARTVAVVGASPFPYVTPKGKTILDERCTCGHLRSEHGPRFAYGHGPCCARAATNNLGCPCAQFLADVGARPDGTTLDRFPNPNGHYEPGNVRWATPKQQAESRRPTSEWADRPGPKNKTHCVRGHALTDDNVKVTSIGRRACKECRRLYWRAARGDRKAIEILNARRSA